MKKIFLFILVMAICVTGFCEVQWNNYFAPQQETQQYRGWDSDRGNYEGYTQGNHWYERSDKQGYSWGYEN